MRFFGVSLVLSAWAVALLGCAQGDTLTGGGDSGAGTPNGGTTPEGGRQNEGGAGGTGASTSDGGNPSTGGMAEGGSGGGVVEKCGNGALDAGEDCDGTALGTATCESLNLGFVGGELGCNVDCTYDVSACEAPPNCGNGVIDAGEDCDGTSLAGASCVSEGFALGTIACGGGCLLDVSGCYTCGNGTVEGPELCDGTNLGGSTCLSLGHDGGTLTCSATCLSLNETPCTDCGDGAVETGEVCDGTNLNGQTCATQGFSSGTLSCAANCGAFNTSACTGQTCGNNIREGGETCDGSDLAGQNCVSQGFNGGTLSCNGSCNGFVTSSCTGAVCQDSVDNDGDGFTDSADPGCTSPTDNDELVFANNCNGSGGPIYDVTFADTSLDVVVTGVTNGAPNAFFPTDTSFDCSTGSANSASEVVLLYRNFAFKSFIDFSLENPGTNFDTVLYVRNGNCTQGTQEFCDDDDGFSLQSYLSLINVPPGDYYIFIDGYQGAGGNYELTIDLPN